MKKLEAFLTSDLMVVVLILRWGFLRLELAEAMEILTIFHFESTILILAWVIFLGLVLVVKIVEFNLGSLKCYLNE